MKKICDLSSLKYELEKANRPKHEYNLDEGDSYFMDTVNCIKRINGGWQIEVFERGSFHDVRKFKTETEACQGFLEEFYPKIASGE